MASHGNWWIHQLTLWQPVTTNGNQWQLAKFINCHKSTSWQVVATGGFIN
jgi:hypothetical protein